MSEKMHAFEGRTIKVKRDKKTPGHDKTELVADVTGQCRWQGLAWRRRDPGGEDIVTRYFMRFISASVPFLKNIQILFGAVFVLIV